MAQFPVTPRSSDPYKNFRFKIKWDGRYVAGVSKASALKRSTEVDHHREGGEASTGRKSPGLTKYPALTLERGVTHDPEFEDWVRRIWNFGSAIASEISLTGFRKDVIVDVYDVAGRLAISYKVYRCWVSEFQALPGLDANANALEFQYLKLENEGWERDYEAVGSSEARFKDPT